MKINPKIASILNADENPSEEESSVETENIKNDDQDMEKNANEIEPIEEEPTVSINREELIQRYLKSEQELQTLIDMTMDEYYELSQTLPAIEPKYQARMREVLNQTANTSITAIKAKMALYDRFLKDIAKNTESDTGNQDMKTVGNNMSRDELLIHIEQIIEQDKKKG